MKTDVKWKVSVSCFTFNQAKYITQTMDGFSMQQTNFPFVCTIVDDASTDNEQDVITGYLDEHFDFSEDSVSYKKETEYADIIFAQHKTNRNCYFAVLLLKENHYSKGKARIHYLKEWRDGIKYLALCEGDDYWTEPLKLQRQFDFLEANPQCSLTYHACKNVFTGECSNRWIAGEEVKESYTSVGLLDNYFQTATIMYRQEIIYSDLYKKVVSIGCSSGDIMLYLIASRLGTIQGINEQMSVYRRHPDGISQNMNNADKLLKNFNDWLKVAIVFGGDIGRWIRRYQLSRYIYDSYVSGQRKLFYRLLLTGIFRSPVSVRRSLRRIRHSRRERNASA